MILNFICKTHRKIVTVANEGTSTEAFNVLVAVTNGTNISIIFSWNTTGLTKYEYYNITANKIIDTQIIDLLPGENQTLVFIWDTTGVEYCHNYTLTAVATIIPPDNDPANNTFTDGEVKVRIMGDINGDGVINVQDLVLVKKAVGSYPGHSRWNPDADLNSDLVVNVKDLVLTKKNVGKACI